MGQAVAIVALIRIAGGVASPVTKAIRLPVAVRFTVRVDAGIAVRVGTAAALIDAVVLAEVVNVTCGIGMTGAIQLAGVTCKAAAAGVAGAARGAVASLRGSGNEPPVVASAPASGGALDGGPVLRQQAGQGKQQASHAIHLLVGTS